MDDPVGLLMRNIWPLFPPFMVMVTWLSGAGRIFNQIWDSNRKLVVRGFWMLFYGLAGLFYYSWFNVDPIYGDYLGDILRTVLYQTAFMVVAFGALILRGVDLIRWGIQIVKKENGKELEGVSQYRLITGGLILMILGGLYAPWPLENLTILTHLY